MKSSISGGDRPFASPAAKQLAAERGIDLVIIFLKDLKRMLKLTINLNKIFVAHK